MSLLRHACDRRGFRIAEDRPIIKADVAQMSNTQRIAKLLTDYLRTRYSNAPSASIVQKLIETLFYASLKTEEARPVSCTVVFVGSGVDLAEGYESLRRLHRYVYVPLTMPVVLTARSLAKFSQAAPPWASSIAVRSSSDELEICGLFDQEIHYQSALNREGEPRFYRPGLFQIEVGKTGSLTLYDGRKLLAKLSQETLVTAFHDVLNDGPIATFLIRYIDKLERRVMKQLKAIFPQHEVTSSLVEAPKLWLQTLSRVLLGIRRLNHGGAVLLIPSKATKDLSTNFAISYEKAETVLERHLLASARWHAARSRMRNEYSETDSLIPATLVQQRRTAFNEQEDARKAALGCTAFISSLAGVDGLILLSGGLRVAGFGVEIRLRKDPPVAWRAANALGTASRLKALNLGEFGTRHRSMMRYCDRHPGSIGFVISQDGDVRAMFKTHRGLVVWDNIQLQEADAEERSEAKAPQLALILRRRDEIEEQLQRSLFFERIDKRQRVTQQAWVTRTGDPLTVRIEKKSRDLLTDLQIFLNQDGDVILAVARKERRLDHEEIEVEETTRYFEFWRLIRITRKTARFERREKIGMSNVRAKLLQLPKLGDSDERPDVFTQELEHTLRSVVAGRKAARAPRVPKGDSRRFRFIQGTTSSDGRMALGFGLAQEVVRWDKHVVSVDETLGRKFYYVDSPRLDGLIRNYIVDVAANKVLGETNCHYVGTRAHYGHRTCRAIWSPKNSFLIHLHQGKWGTIEATAVHIDDGHLLAADLLKPLTDYAYEFLSQKKERSIRRFGTERFAESLRCTAIDERGSVRFELFGEIPKSGEDDSTFSLIGRFRIYERAGVLSLKFLECKLGPHLYWT
jgi:hypothetical protein